jgi:hypothetical protein
LDGFCIGVSDVKKSDSKNDICLDFKKKKAFSASYHADESTFPLADDLFEPDARHEKLHRGGERAEHTSRSSHSPDRARYGKGCTCGHST